jgi:hypothetical protein
VNDNDQNNRKKLKIMDFSVFKDTAEVFKNQNNETEKNMHINVSHIDLNDLLDWWKNHEEKFKYLSRVATNVL